MPIKRQVALRQQVPLVSKLRILATRRELGQPISTRHSNPMARHRCVTNRFQILLFNRPTSIAEALPTLNITSRCSMQVLFTP